MPYSEEESLKRVEMGDFTIWNGNKPPDHMMPLLNRLKGQPSQKDGLEAIRQILTILGMMDEYKSRARRAEVRLTQIRDYLEAEWSREG